MKQPIFNQYTINTHIHRFEEIVEVVDNISKNTSEEKTISFLLKLNAELMILSKGIKRYLLSLWLENKK